MRLGNIFIKPKKKDRFLEIALQELEQTCKSWKPLKQEWKGVVIKDDA